MKYYIIWIEGIGYKSGEKVKALSNTSFLYTTRMTEAMRIRECDIHYMIDYMKRHGIAEFVYNSNKTFIPTNYVPKGTLHKFPQI